MRNIYRVVHNKVLHSDGPLPHPEILYQPENKLSCTNTLAYFALPLVTKKFYNIGTKMIMLPRGTEVRRAWICGSCQY
jgi:hypothetical protein